MLSGRRCPEDGSLIVGDAQAARMSAIRVAPEIRNDMLGLGLVRCWFNDITLKIFPNSMIFIVLNVWFLFQADWYQRSLLVARI